LEIKYGWKELEIRNNFVYNLPLILNGFCTKIQRNFYALNYHRNLLEILGTLEFDEIWLACSLLHFIARKNKFSVKED
jgi:hypothetical protein